MTKTRLNFMAATTVGSPAPYPTLSWPRKNRAWSVPLPDRRMKTVPVLLLNSMIFNSTQMQRLPAAAGRKNCYWNSQSRTSSRQSLPWILHGTMTTARPGMTPRYGWGLIRLTCRSCWRSASLVGTTLSWWHSPHIVKQLRVALLHYGGMSWVEV